MRGPKLFYGWWIVAVGTLTYALGYGARYGFAVIFPAMVEEMGWPRDVTATVLSSHMIVYGAVAPAVGGVVDRIGPRKAMGIGSLVLSLGLWLSSRGSEPWHFWISFGVLFGSGLCLVGAVPFAIVVREWFERRRGLAFSLLYLGSAGSYAWYPVVAWGVERWGWRGAFSLEGIILAMVLFPLLTLVVRGRKEERGLETDGSLRPQREAMEDEKEALGLGGTIPGWTLLRAMRAKEFWFTCLATFSLWGMMQHIVMAHNVAFAVDQGIPKMRVSAILSLVGVAYLAGALISPISDKVGREKTISFAAIWGSVGVGSLLLVNGPHDEGFLYLHALSFGLANGMASPAIAASVTDLFRGPKVGPVIGFIWLCFALGGCIGPWLGGRIFEATGNYKWAFWVALFWYWVACIAIWIAAPRKARELPSV